MTVLHMDLAELIRRTRGERSYEALEAESNGKYSRQRWQQIATMPPAQFLRPDSIRLLAQVLGVAESTVVLATARSLGLDIQAGGPLAELIPPSASRLTERQVAAVVAVIRAMLEPADPPAAPGDEVEDFKRRMRERRERLEELTPHEPPAAERPGGQEHPAPKRPGGRDGR